MKTIKELDKEIKLRKCYLPHLAGELKALKDVLELIDELCCDADICPLKELKKRITGK